MSVHEQLKHEFSLSEQQVEAVVNLIDTGNTIPFIARYRKEMTGNLDDQVLRRFYDQLMTLRALQERREAVYRLIDDQGQMNPDLASALARTKTLAEIDDVYRPFRPKRRTRALLAQERGLAPLAELLRSQPADAERLRRLAGQLADANSELAGVDDALAGARDIIAEQVADDAWIRRRLRQMLLQDGILESKAKTQEVSVYEPFYSYSEPVARIAAHRILAINRGEREKFLSVRLVLDPEKAVAIVRSRLISRESAAEAELARTAEDAWKRLLLPSLETEVRHELTAQAEHQAIDVFAANLRSLLLQPPVRGHCVLGLDPGYRTGCKLAVVDATGRVLETGVIYPTPPQNRLREAGERVTALILNHHIDLAAIGNGTASRETERFLSDLIREHNLPVRCFVVNEAGASVYSASELAAAEFPEYDVTLRSAISIARRLQDPLAELVKIEPRSIGVGQYQHDIGGSRLDDTLRGVVEDCVNQVGVDLNTASAALLTYIAGLSAGVARRIVARRERSGAFRSRRELLQVPQLGPRTFEQCAGFLRIADAAEPLDNTSVHPEAYDQVYQLSRLLQTPPSAALAEKARRQDITRLAGQLGLGELTFTDILTALAKPGRDPRDDLPQPTMISEVLELTDLKPGMTLQGIVRNVADFGAFVDIGVHQDGLVHISELADHYVRHPLAVVQTGQAVRVRILQVDPVKKRISLSMKDLEQPKRPDA
jgi:uncharacterized protein